LRAVGGGADDRQARVDAQAAYRYRAARCGEALALTWEHARTEGRYALFPTTKNGHPREVPMYAHLIELIDQLPKTHAQVFPIPARWRPTTVGSDADTKPLVPRVGKLSRNCCFAAFSKRPARPDCSAGKHAVRAYLGPRLGPTVVVAAPTPTWGGNQGQKLVAFGGATMRSPGGTERRKLWESQ